MERFMELADKYQGFEFVQAFRDFEDHHMGAKGNVCWYTIICDGKVKKTYVGKCTDGEWTDVCITGSGKRKKSKEMRSGSTIKRIEKEAYLGQKEDWVTRRQPSVIEAEHPFRHYVKGFGDKALDISEQYGVTITYSDLSDVPAGFHLRYLWTGKDVELPEGF